MKYFILKGFTRALSFLILLLFLGVTYNSFAAAGKPSLYKITYKTTATDAVLYESDGLADMWTYIGTHTITDAVTLQFNTSDTFLIDNTLAFSFANAGFLFTVKAASGHTPVFDVQLKQPSVMSSNMNNIWFEGLTFQNADPNTANGCIIRQYGNTHDVTYKTITAIHGFCGMRGTGGITNLTIEGFSCEEVGAGALRLGDGAAVTEFDLYNLVVKNCKFSDRLNGANISGTTSKHSPYLLLKKADRMQVENISFPEGISCGLGQFESSRDVVLKNILLNNFGANGYNSFGISTHGCNGVTIENMFVKPIADGVGKTCYFSQNDQNIKIFHSSFITTNTSDVCVNFATAKKILAIAGSIFVGKPNFSPLAIGFSNSGYTATTATDFVSEHDNIFICSELYTALIGFSNLSDVNNGSYTKLLSSLGSLSAANYKATYARGQNSYFGNDVSKITLETRLNQDGTTSPAVYLSDASWGRQHIKSTLGGITADLTGASRSNPTDAGAYDKDSDFPSIAEPAASATDTIPTAYAFSDKTGVARSATIESDPLLILGINAGTNIRVIGGEYSVNGGAFTAAGGTINNYDAVKVRATSSSSYSTASTVVLTVGGVSDTFSFTTEVYVADAVPNIFAFTDQNDVVLNADIESNSIGVSGINVPAQISITGGEFSINGASYTSTSTTVVSGDAVKVRVKSSNSNFTLTAATLVIGGLSDDFEVTTIADPNAPPVVKFSLIKTADESEIYSNNSITNMLTYLSSYNFAQPVTLRVNTSETFVVTSSINLNYNTNGHLFTIENKPGEKPVFDGQGSITSLINSTMSNLKVKGLKFTNINLIDNNAAIIKQTGGSNVTFAELTLVRGNKAFYASGGASNLTVENIKVEQIINGSFKIGNTGAAQTYDVSNVLLRNITLKDNLSGAYIPGTTSKYKPVIELAKCDGVEIEYVVFSDNFEGRVFTLNRNHNAIIKRVLARAFGYAGNGTGIYSTDNDGLTFTNCFIGAATDLSNNTKTCWDSSRDRNITIEHNTFYTNNGENNGNQDYCVNFSQVRVIRSIKGNIFLGSSSGSAIAMGFDTNGYSATIGNDYLAETDNIFLTNNNYDPGLGFAGLTDLNGGSYTKVSINGGKTFAEYKTLTGRGDRSILESGRSAKIAFESIKYYDLTSSPAVYLTTTSKGSKSIANQISTVNTDLTGVARVFPSDAGAYDRHSYFNSELSGLSLSEGILSPAFSTTTAAYTGSVPNTSSSVNITATLSDVTGTIKINNTPAVNGSAFAAALAVGVNTINVVTLAKDLQTTKTYVLNITREKSSNANLSGISYNVGSATATFNSGTTSYTIALPDTATSVDITPTSEEATSSISINGTPVNSGSPFSLAVSPSSNTASITVTAEDGTTQKIYTVTFKKNQKITFSAIASKTYGDAGFVLTASGSSGLPVVFTSGNLTVASIAGNMVNINGAGTVEIHAAGAGDSFYIAADTTQILIVSKKTLSVSLNAAPLITKVYAGTNSANLSAGNYLLTGTVNGDDVTVTGTAVYDSKNAGTGKTVTATGFVLGGSKKDNYELATSSATGTGKITEKSISIMGASLPLITKVYDGNTGARHDFGNITLIGIEPGDSVLISGDASFETPNAGTDKDIEIKNFVLSGLDKENYILSNSSVIVKGNITQAPLTITAENKNKTYGSVNPALTFTYTGLVNGETGIIPAPIVSTSVNTATGSGEYDITASASSLNYDIAAVGGKFTVNKKPLTITVEDKSKIYGEAVPELTLKYVGLINGVTSLSAVSVNTLVTATSNVGLYDITVGGTSPDYDITFVKGKLSVTKRDLTIKAEDKVKLYGDANPPLTAGYIGLAPGETLLPGITFITNAVNTSGVGSYTIEASGTSSNYNVTFLPGNLSINKKELIVQAEDKVKFVGELFPALTLSYHGFVNGENESVLKSKPIISSSANANSGVGLYPLEITGGECDNYYLTLKQGSLTIKTGAPTDVQLATYEFYENQPAGTVAGKINALSENSASKFTYSLISGPGDTDNRYFVIENDMISAKKAFNFELEPNVNIRINAVDQNGAGLEKEFSLKVIDVNEVPTVATVSDQLVCFDTNLQVIPLTGISAGEDAGQTVQINVSASNPGIFSELGVSGSSIKYRLKNDAVSSSTLTVTVIDDGGVAGGGANTFNMSFKLSINPTPGLETSVSGEIVIGTEVELSASGGVNYTWRTVEGYLPQTSSSITVRPLKTTTYTVKVATAAGCVVEKAVTIPVKDDITKLNAANILSPNGDGKNDKFIIKNIDLYPENTVKIFDRAGRLIFSTRNYANDWDGTFGGVPLAEDTYLYIIELRKGIKDKIKGYITIISDK